MNLSVYINILLVCFN